MSCVWQRLPRSAGEKELAASASSNQQPLMNAIPQLGGSNTSPAKKNSASATAQSSSHYLKDLVVLRFRGIDLSHVYVDESGQLGPQSPSAAPQLHANHQTSSPWSHGQPKRGWCLLAPRTAHQQTHSMAAGLVRPLQTRSGAHPPTLFDNYHLADRESHPPAEVLLRLRRSQIQSEVYGSWNAISGAYFAGVFDENRIKVPAISQLTISPIRPPNVWLSMDWGCRRPPRAAGVQVPQRHDLPDGRIAGPGSVFLIDCIHTNLRNGDSTEIGTLVIALSRP